jgi:hypothetical protein
MAPQSTRPTILEHVTEEEFERLASWPEDSIIAALEQGEADRRTAEAEARPPTIEANRRFARAR